MPTVLTIVTAASHSFWRCLHQLLASAERHGLHRRHQFLAYDLGLHPAEREQLERRFPWCGFRRFRFEPHPPHVALTRGSYAWKPLIVAEVASAGDPVLWLDSATVLKTGSLAQVTTSLHALGTYLLRGQAPIAERCDPAILDALGLPIELRHKPVLSAGVIGVDPAHSAARSVVAEWRSHAMIESHICPSLGVREHNYDQALLTAIVYMHEARGELRLSDGEIDISSACPVRWMSSRNKVPPTFPVWADPVARASYATAKALDRLGWRLARLHGTILSGLHRATWEHYSVFVSRDGGDCVTRITSPPREYYADPFIWRDGGRAFVFVERFDYLRCRGRIACIPLDDELRPGEPIDVLPLDCHASFPLIFSHSGVLYLVPETHARRSIDLYACDGFPRRWRLARRLLFGIDAADTVLFQRDGLWWLITSTRAAGEDGRSLAVYFADDLLRGRFRPHPINAQRLYARAPFSSYRNGGPVFVADDTIVRVIQRSRHHYGESLGLMRITALTPDTYREEPTDGPVWCRGIVERWSPHHLSRHGDLLAWDVRDRVSFPRDLLGRWAGTDGATGGASSRSGA